MGQTNRRQGSFRGEGGPNESQAGPFGEPRWAKRITGRNISNHSEIHFGRFGNPVAGGGRHQLNYFGPFGNAKVPKRIAGRALLEAKVSQTNRRQSPFGSQGETNESQEGLFWEPR